MRPPWSGTVTFGWLYDHDGGWRECNERVATVIVCGFLFWGAH